MSRTYRQTKVPWGVAPEDEKFVKRRVGNIIVAPDSKIGRFHFRCRCEWCLGFAKRRVYDQQAVKEMNGHMPLRNGKRIGPRIHPGYKLGTT